MSIFFRRPLCAGSCIFIFASVLVAFLPIEAVCLLLCALAALSLVFVLKKKKAPARWGFAAFALLALALAIHTFSFVIPRQNVDSLSEHPHTYRGRVVDAASYASGQSLTVQLLKIDGENKRIRVSVFTRQENIVAGDVVFFSGEISSLESESDTALYALSNGIVGEIEPEGEMVVLSHSFSLRKAFADLNQWLSDALFGVSKGEGGGLFPALFLGNKSHLSLYTSLMFRRAGVSHLLALSGMHLTVLMALLRETLEKMKVSRRRADGIGLVFILLYTILVGASASILRAAVMSGFYIFAWIAGRKNDVFTSLFFTGALLLCFSRGTVYDMGFWLSFFATFAIILIAKERWLVHLRRLFDLAEGKAKRKLHKWALFGACRLGEAIAITVFATLFTLPLCALFFGDVSLLSIPATVILSPLVNLALLLSFPLLALSFVPFVGQALGGVASAVPNALLTVVAWMGERPQATVSVGFFGVKALAVMLLAALTLAPLLGGKMKKRLFLLAGAVFCLSALLVTVGQIVTDCQTYIAYEEKGAEDFVLISDAREQTLVDLSSGNGNSTKTALSIMKDAHVTCLDRLVLTHWHKTHVNALMKTVRAVWIGEIYAPSPLTEEEKTVCEDFCRVAEQLRIKVTLYHAEEALRFGKTAFCLFRASAFPVNPHTAFAVSFDRKGETLMLMTADFTYLPLSSAAMDGLAKTKTLILSGHGGAPVNYGYLPLTDATEQLIIPSKDTPFYTTPEILEHLSHVTVKHDTKFRISFP